MKNPEVKPLDVQAVTEARQRFMGAVRLTPCSYSRNLSRLTECEVYCKQEHLQWTGSFKERGAHSALSLLSRGTAGVIAASAGNHALGLAWHGQKFGVSVTVVMPRSAPRVKIERCKDLGAEVILHGTNYDQAHEHAMSLGTARGLEYVHPFDDVRVMAGQGTIALELLEQVPDLEAVLVPVGGGGLLAGVTTVLHALKPGVSVIGVEPSNAACFTRALAARRPVRLAVQHTLADGLAVAEAGQKTLATVSSCLNRIVTVTEDDIALGMWRLNESEDATVEGAGAVGLAALLSGRLPDLKGKRTVLLLTGGNVDPCTHQYAVKHARSIGNPVPSGDHEDFRGAKRPRPTAMSQGRARFDSEFNSSFGPARRAIGARIRRAIVPGETKTDYQHHHKKHI